jgi:cytochrome c peroxidase
VRRDPRALLIGVVALSVVCEVCATAATASHDDRLRYTPAELAAIYRHSPLSAPQADPTNAYADSAAAAKLGQCLFFDRRLSANGRVSCATCHEPARGFTDGRKLARGIAVGTRNTPSVTDAAFGHWFFWDGRADSLWSQALQPLENPREAGSDRLHIAHLIDGDPRLRAAYQRIFGPLPNLDDPERFPAHARPDADARLPVARAWAGMTAADRHAVNRLFSNLGKAIEAYERRLIDRSSPFDRYVAALRSGDAAGELAISPAAKRGLKLFVGTANCDLCHSGPTFSDGQFHNLGLPVLPGEAPDTGRAAGIRLLTANPFNGAGPFSDDRTGPSRDRISYLPSPASQLGAFKTPDLRNVALTAPYMHDGRFATLEQVLDFYAEGKAASHGPLVGVREETANLVPPLNAAQKADLIAFLKTLTGDPLPRILTQAPARCLDQREHRALAARRYPCVRRALSTYPSKRTQFDARQCG